MDFLSTIKRPIESELAVYREMFEASLTHTDTLLHSALAYIRERRGKMMRPMLVLLAARAWGGANDATYRAAVTLELLHTASLVHDDVVDESDERRGRRSVNAAYGNQVAVLVGDYLLSEALLQAAQTGSTAIVETIAGIGKTLSEGELFQMSNIQSTDISEEAYGRIIRQKTAVLFAACAELGAQTAGADEARVAQARELGETVGLCFQIRDDIFDYYTDPRVGKPTGADLAEGKITLPLIYALQHGADREMHDLAARAKEGTADREAIERLVAYAKEEGGIDYARRVMDTYVARGLQLIAEWPDADVREAMTAYLHYVAAREV